MDASAMISVILFNNIDFRGTLREQPYGARYAYRAEITAISPLTGMPIRGNAGDKIARSIYSNETDMDELLNTIVMAIIKLYSNNCIALNRAVEAFAIYRPEMTTPSIAAERFAVHYEDSLSAKAEKGGACPAPPESGYHQRGLRTTAAEAYVRD